MLSNYNPSPYYCELTGKVREPLPHAQQFAGNLSHMAGWKLAIRRDQAQEDMFNQGITFRLYSGNTSTDRVLPFDAIPRMVSREEWGNIERGVIQRVTALKLHASLARLKRRGLPGAPVLCADTTVALGRRILGKPGDAAEARRMLADLAGRRHRVLTAVAVGRPGARTDRTWAALSTSWVSFEALSASRIRRYVDSGEPMGKAGAYAIQGQAGLWVSHISGSYSGIMGLPAHETAQVLAAAGVPLG